MLYRQHDRNQVGANTGLRSLISRYKTIHDGWWFGQVQLIARLTGQEFDPFVASWLPLHGLQMLRLSFSAWSCRRRMRDKVLFFFVCWLKMLVKNKG
jgi:rhamnosyltransferase